MLQYVQSLTPDEAQKLTSEVGKEVLDAMGELINSLLKEADVPADAVMETSDLKMRELLVWQARACAQYVASIFRGGAALTVYSPCAYTCAARDGLQTARARGESGAEGQVLGRRGGRQGVGCTA